MRFARILRKRFAMMPLADEEAVIANWAELFSGYRRATVEGLVSINGLVSVHKFPPTIAEIVEWVEGPKRRAEALVSAPPAGMRNFTRERLELERLETLPAMEQTSEERRAFVKRELASSTLDPKRNEVPPEWLEHPDVDAAWRKIVPPSDELKRDMAQHLRETALAKHRAETES